MNTTTIKATMRKKRYLVLQSSTQRWRYKRLSGNRYCNCLYHMTPQYLLHCRSSSTVQHLPHACQQLTNSSNDYTKWCHQTLSPSRKQTKSISSKQNKTKITKTIAVMNKSEIICFTSTKDPWVHQFVDGGGKLWSFLMCHLSIYHLLSLSFTAIYCHLLSLVTSWSDQSNYNKK